MVPSKKQLTTDLQLVDGDTKFGARDLDIRRQRCTPESVPLESN